MAAGSQPSGRELGCWRFLTLEFCHVLSNDENRSMVSSVANLVDLSEGYPVGLQQELPASSALTAMYQASGAQRGSAVPETANGSPGDHSSGV